MQMDIDDLYQLVVKHPEATFSGVLLIRGWSMRVSMTGIFW
jgi:hypothetical protein